MTDLRLGKWQDVLCAVEADALICDPPYSDVTHAGQSELRAGITYDAVTPEACTEIAEFWGKRIKFWSVIFSDHIAWAWHQRAWELEGWYTFAPVVWVKSAPVPRIAGDGPTCSCEYLMVARRKSTPLPGSLPGHYLVPRTTHHEHPGQKNLDAMRAVIRDYSKQGQTIVDPFAGNGTTLVAAAMEGRVGIGAEVDAATHAKASRRLSEGFTPNLFGDNT